MIGWLAHWNPQGFFDSHMLLSSPLLPPPLGICQEACPAMLPPAPHCRLEMGKVGGPRTLGASQHLSWFVRKFLPLILASSSR